MKKLIFIMITVAVSLTVACDKENDKDDNVAKMTMTTAKEGLVRFYLKGTGTAVINWGDGTPNETTTFGDGMTQHSHTYSISTIRTITIIGDVTYLCCGHNPGNSGDIFNNQLTSLDVSKNAALTYFECSNNQLTALDVSKNTALTTYLGCYNNQLTALDVSKNTTLSVLFCYNNQLTVLDVSKNMALTGLACDNNQLTALDVSKNTALTTLGCGNNQLTVLDVSKNMALLDLACYNNQLTALDVSKNTMLISLIITSNLFEAERLNALFLTLHSNTVTIGGFTNKKAIYILNNPGTATCNPNIAEEKGWDMVATVN